MKIKNSSSYIVILLLNCLLTSCFNPELKEQHFISFHLTHENKITQFYEYSINIFTNKKKEIKEVGHNKHLSIYWYNNLSLACEIADFLETKISKNIINNYTKEIEKNSVLSLNKDYIQKLISDFDEASALTISTIKHVEKNKGFDIQFEKIFLNDAIMQLLDFMNELKSLNFTYDYNFTHYNYHRGKLIDSSDTQNVISVDSNNIKCFYSRLETDHTKLED